jgi:uncharacterized protein (DUF433 family)
MDASLSTNEIVALFGVDERRVRKEVEHGVLGGAKPLRFDLASVVYLVVLNQLGFELGVETRRTLFGEVTSALRSPSRRPSTIPLGPIADLRLGRVVDEAERQIHRFEAWKSRLVTDDRILGGEPVFPKSRLAVRHVGEMLLRGASPADVFEDYPYLNEKDLDFAMMYTKAYPRMGRPSERQAPPR